MSATAVNRLLRRPRRRLAVLVVVLGLTAAVAVHHMDAGDMGDMGMHAAMVMCLALLPAVAVAVAAAIGALWVVPRLNLRVLWPLLLLAPVPLPRARSSPVGTVALKM